MSKEGKPMIGLSDDYATAYKMTDDYRDIFSLYYGYEETFCPDHKTEDECYDREDECTKRDWCFRYTEDGVKLIFTSTELEEYCPRITGRDPESYLLAGILKMMDEGVLEFNKGKAAAKLLKGEL